MINDLGAIDGELPTLDWPFLKNVRIKENYYLNVYTQVEGYDSSHS